MEFFADTLPLVRAGSGLGSALGSGLGHAIRIRVQAQFRVQVGAMMSIRVMPYQLGLYPIKGHTLPGPLVLSSMMYAVEMIISLRPT